MATLYLPELKSEVDRFISTCKDERLLILKFGHVVINANAQNDPAAKEEAGSITMPKIGEMAPDFKLSYVDAHGMKDVSLSQYRGQKQVVLAFYVFAFTGG